MTRIKNNQIVKENLSPSTEDSILEHPLSSPSHESVLGDFYFIAFLLSVFERIKNGIKEEIDQNMYLCGCEKPTSDSENDTLTSPYRVRYTL